MNKRAAIYIRTSSEHQGAKASPDEQEADCRKLADENGYIIEAVYRDIERYRAKKRLVDPSGTRSDRPGLVAMMEDAKARRFDVILAWREDRLYRGLRAMLFVLETIQESKIDIQLAKENFDQKMAPLKAWLAQMELDGMRERMSMGVKARLRAGKANTGQDRYGYKREGENIEIVEDEAKWVRKIFEWYLEGVNRIEIRRRLIEAGAPQKGGTVPRKTVWSRATIDGIFKGARDYAYGIKVQRRGGDEYEIPIPPILDPGIYQRFIQVRESNKKYPSHNLKHNYLLGGLLICSCGKKWGARANTYKRRNRHGEMVDRKSFYWTYYCREFLKERIKPDCPRSIGARKADDFVWKKVCEALNDPDVLLGNVRMHIEELRHQAETVLEDKERIKQELDSIVMERQKVITWARKGSITDEDMEYQLTALTLQEMNLKKEFATYGEVLQLTAHDDWEKVALEYFLDLRVGIESLNKNPESEEEKDEIFQLKRKIIKTLVNRVVIDEHRNLKVEIRVNVLDLLKQAASPNFSEIQKAGTYNHKQ
ncbi:MAG: recombinase family protein [Anaerolineales bacterium]